MQSNGNKNRGGWEKVRVQRQRKKHNVGKERGEESKERKSQINGTRMDMQKNILENGD